ncbi:ATP-binding protein [Deinococcus cellulosilyticus]|uniref:ATPase AAA n=1 Tax=Deinococcus cellulosilyticus (strain DSM 18568 / NBRC 106333 / KACC 11606 / 5516J-15) TaxID=1223518 RepID=A0A511N9T8_DEIC1|nr:ATP-binding protein [Deinococcus cellulosilyticus]GEM49286.1 ATPase AAA [Deinococcus cellulosilyticus NBRC 106333 = KACC 11606]
MQLPIGIQDFQKLREGGYVYVDKTMHMMPFVQGGYYFFSRPRRFGKSLTLTTLKAIFEGQKHLFEGLWIHDQHDFEPRPVLHLNFSGIDSRSLPLATGILKHLQREAGKQGLTLDLSSPSEAFQDLVLQLSRNGKVVLLIDEYDKPLVDFLDDPQRLKDHQNLLKSMYGTIKGLDEHLHLVILTGVSRFGKLSLFSDLNNLYDATLDPRFAELCGYTREELQGKFADQHGRAQEHLKMEPAPYWEMVRRWYNGYSWDGQCKVYCPFSMLVFLQNPGFKGHWYETGTPTFLLKLVRQEAYTPFEFEDFTAPGSVLTTASIDQMSPIGLMFQTGYLTIKSIEHTAGGTLYDLTYPNEEVRQAFSQGLLNEYIQRPQYSEILGVRLQAALEKQNWEAFFAQVNTTLAGVPYEIFPRKEAFFNSLMHLMLMSTGLPTLSQVQTSKGRMDTVIELEKQVFIFEFKLDGTAQEALEQIKGAGYGEKYLGKRVVMVGVNFDSASKTVSEWVAEPLIPGS